MQTTVDHQKRGPKAPPFYSPILLATSRHNKRYASNYRLTECGLERKCSLCQEFWPADTEFFSPNKGTLRSQCKACQAEAKRLKEKR